MAALYQLTSMGLVNVLVWMLITEPRMSQVSAHVQTGVDADGAIVIGSFKWVIPTLSSSPDPEAGLLIGPRGITRLPLRLAKGGI